jgi:hypothetical protein
MSQAHVFEDESFYPSVGAQRRMALRDEPLPYRFAVPFIAALSLGLWVMVWQLGSIASHLVFG